MKATIGGAVIVAGGALGGYVAWLQRAWVHHPVGRCLHLLGIAVGLIALGLVIQHTRITDGPGDREQ